MRLRWPSRRTRLITVGSVFALALLVTQGESWRARASAIGPAPGLGPIAVDADRLMADVRALAAPELAGRRTGSPGGLRTAALLEERMAIFLEPVAGTMRQTFPVAPHRPRPGEPDELVGTNVFGVLPGREEPERYLLLTAHFDHEGTKRGEIYPGADDNASGVATLLAAIDHFARHPPRHSLLFVAFDAEELGLVGAEELVAAPPVPREQMLAVVNLDMVSRSERREIYVAGTWHCPFLRRPVATVAARHPVRVLFGHDRPFWLGGFSDDWTGQSDHAPFHEAGIPFLYFGVEDHPDYHRPTDTPDRIDPTFFAGVAGLVIDTLAELDRSWTNYAPHKEAA